MKRQAAKASTATSAFVFGVFGALALQLSVSSCASAPAAPAASPVVAPSPAVAASEGWRPLFDGKTLEGWNVTGTAVWRVEDGVVVGTQDGDPKRSGMLVTREHFQDFELEIEFLIDEHGKYNSGVYLRNKPDARGRTGYQVNIGRGAVQEYCGGVYTDKWLAKGDETDTIRKPRDWNHFWIRAHGAHVQVKLNGQSIVDFRDPTPKPEYLEPGLLALQTYGAEGHSGFVKFRNARIRVLPDRR